MGTQSAIARSNTEALSARSERLIERIERSASDEERLWKPAPAKWSLTEVVQHLALVAGGMLRTARPARGSDDLFGSAKSTLLRVALRSRLRFPAPVAAIVPRAGVTWSDAVARLRASNERWTEFVESDAPERTRFVHPILRKLTAAETTGFLVEHFDHHVRQVDRLFAALATRQRSPD